MIIEEKYSFTRGEYIMVKHSNQNEHHDHEHEHHEHEHHEHDHNHYKGHHHHHDVSSMNKGKLLFVIIFNFIITLSEVIGGIVSGSLSLISDALHNLSDTVSIIISFVSIKISEKPKSKTKTYGYKRANILSAFINSAALIGISLFLAVEAVRKFISPQEVEGNTVIIVATIGLLGNLFSVLLLRKGAKESLNLKSSYLHLLSDTLSSVVVIAGGILIKLYSIYWIDPVLTVFINIIIFKSSYHVIKESIDILMQSTPMEINIDEVIEEVLSINGVKGIHHVHVWRLDEKNIILESHIEINDMLISETEEISHTIEHALKENFNITHSVIQFESSNCESNVCEI